MTLSDFKTLVLEKIGDEWFRDGIDVSLKIALTIVIFVCFYFSAQLLQKSLRAFARGNKQHVLFGFCVFGTGFPPTYWWLTDGGEVAVMSTMLATYVLNERSD
mgnify:CR=1 FL=1